jgi:hypothetical protein
MCTLNENRWNRGNKRKYSPSKKSKKKVWAVCGKVTSRFILFLRVYKLPELKNNKWIVDCPIKRF